jgi:hypothetical protein
MRSKIWLKPNSEKLLKRSFREFGRLRNLPSTAGLIPLRGKAHEWATRKGLLNPQRPDVVTA